MATWAGLTHRHRGTAADCPHARPPYSSCMQFTIRNLPAELDHAIRERARAENKCMSEVAIEALQRAFGVRGDLLPPQRNLSGIAGSWHDSPELAAALAEQRRVDPDLWQ